MPTRPRLRSVPRSRLRVEALEDRRTPAINVAVVGGTNDNSGFVAIVNQLNNDTFFNFQATLVNPSEVDTAAELAPYDAVVIGNNGFNPGGDPFDNSAFTTALRTWVEGGGGVVATGRTVFGAGPGTGTPVPNIAAIVPVNTAGGSGIASPTTVIPNPVPHPVMVGVGAFPINPGDASEFPTDGVDSGATVLATVNGQPAVVVDTVSRAGTGGAVGRGVYLGPVYSAAAVLFNTTELRSGTADRLLEQAVAWAHNAAPDTLTLTPKTLTENLPAGTTAGTLKATDPDPGDTLTLSLVNGPGSTDNDAFYLSGDSLLTNRAFDFEAQSAFSVRIRATDIRGRFIEQAFTIAVQDLPEAPTGLTLSNAAVNEGRPVGTVVGSFSASDPDVGETFNYALTAGAGGTDNGSFTLLGNVLKTAEVFNYEAKKLYSIRARAIDPTNNTIDRIFTITVEDLTGADDNRAPTLAGVPVSVNVNEGDTVSFTATATDADGNSLRFSLVGAPAAAAIHLTTGAFSWTTTEANGPDTYVFNVQVSDGLATTSQPVTVVVRESNKPPTLAGVPAAVTTVRGVPVTFKATATDPDLLNGKPNALSYSLVGAPAGAAIDPDTGAFTWAPGGEVEDNIYSFLVRVVDDGVPAMTHTLPIVVTVANAALVNGDLLVGGTSLSDTIAVNPSKDKLGLVVTMNKQVLGTFPLASVGRVGVHALGGNDKVTVNAKVTKGADLFGGSGDDALTGGAGADVLVGGAGNDKLAGGQGANVLIGGAGADRLAGGTGDDLLIAGATVFDLDPTGLAAIRAEWASGSSYADRVAHLSGPVGGINGTTFLTAATVFDDRVKDVLGGKKGTDWFVFSALDTADPLATETKTTV